MQFGIELLITQKWKKNKSEEKENTKAFPAGVKAKNTTKKSVEGCDDYAYDTSGEQEFRSVARLGLYFRDGASSEFYKSKKMAKRNT